MLLVFQNKTNIEIIGFHLMHFGFALDSSDIDLLNIDLLDIHSDLLDRDIPCKQFVCLQDVFKTSSRHVIKMSSRHVFKKSWRRLQCSNFSSSKTSSRRLARCLQDVFKTSSQDVFKTFWRRLQDISWRHLQDVLKSNKCLLGSYWVWTLQIWIFQLDLIRQEKYFSVLPKLYAYS